MLNKISQRFRHQFDIDFQKGKKLAQQPDWPVLLSHEGSVGQAKTKSLIRTICTFISCEPFKLDNPTPNDANQLLNLKWNKQQRLYVLCTPTNC